MNKLDTEFLIVDVQNHFLIDDNFMPDKELKENLLNNIRTYFLKNKIKKTTIVCDQHHIDNNGKVEDYSELEEFLDYNYDEIEELLNSKYLELYKNNVPIELVYFLYKEDIEINIVKKYFGDLRDTMDRHELELLCISLKMKTDPYLNSIIEEYNAEFFNIPSNRISELYTNFEELTGEFDKNIITENIAELYETHHYSKENIEEEYSYSFLNSLLNKKLIVMGGGKSECLLEEIIKLKTYGYLNNKIIKIDYDDNLMYGGTLEDFESKLEDFQYYGKKLLLNNSNTYNNYNRNIR